MRLWPLAILDQLPRQQLLGQHRECCALRGQGWGRKHATVDYVFKHPYWWLAKYHGWVIVEMLEHKYEIDDRWLSERYRGEKIGFDNTSFANADYSYDARNNITGRYEFYPRIYPEHDEKYLDECISNLAAKGVKIDRNIALQKLEDYAASNHS